MVRLKDLRDGMIIGAAFGVFASAVCVILWWAVDAILERVGPAMVVGWSGITCAVVAGLLAAFGGDR